VREDWNSVKLQNGYRMHATNPNEHDLSQLEINRKIFLEDNINSMLNNRQNLNVQFLSNLARTNQNRIPYLCDPVKDRVETDGEMIRIATNFYQDLYGTKPIVRTYRDELFKDLSTSDEDDLFSLESATFLLMDVKLH
jgi:hypothetical protein